MQILVGAVGAVPEGLLTIAQHFSAGAVVGRRLSPGGTAETARPARCFSRPSGTY